MRKLIFLVILGGALVAADVFAKAYAESKLEDRIEEGAPGEQRPSASIESFPFLGRLLVSGTIGDIRMRAHAVPAGGLEFDTVELDLDGVRVDRDLLFQEKVRLREIDAGVVRLAIDRALPVGRIPIPQTPLIPCDAEARSDGERVVVSCTFEHVPQAFVDAANDLNDS